MYNFNMKKVVFFIGTLNPGGAETKLIRYILPYFSRKKDMKPMLLVLRDEGSLTGSVPEGVEVFCVNEEITTGLHASVFRTRRILKKIRPDVVVSFMWYPAVISYLVRRAGFIPFRHIVHETVNMTEHLNDVFRQGRFNPLKLFLIRSAYADADIVTTVSKGVQNDLIENFNVKEGRIKVIYDGIDHELISRMSSEVAGLNLDGMVIVTVGRLVYQKGFDILLKAFHMMRGQVRSRLLIIGDGAEREGLVNLAKQLNISKDTIFAGYKSNPYRYMRESTVFCSASRYEGFSIVILEAMVLGLPVIATDCPSGPAEILDSGRHGILVPPEDPEAIADKLLRVLPDIELRRTLSGRSLLRAQDFNLETFLEQWEELIEI